MYSRVRPAFSFLRVCALPYNCTRTVSTSATTVPPSTRTKMAPKKPATPAYTGPKTPLRILLLHGYTQSGENFYNKTRALQKYLAKNLPTYELSFSCPSGPIGLFPEDVPGFQKLQGDETGNDLDPNAVAEAERVPKMFAYWKHAPADPEGLYLGLEESIDFIVDLAKKEGPFDGIIAFSQGAAFAAMLASLFEPGRKAAFEHFEKTPERGVAGIPFPKSVEELNHPPLKFAACYCGFAAPGARYRAFYSEPKISTPLLHVVGSLDAIVPEAKWSTLIRACEEDPEKAGRVVRHPGGHFLPSQRPYMDATLRFIKSVLEKEEKKEEKQEEKAEDMDVPF